MRYPMFRAQQANWTLPACLQSLATIRMFQEPSQAEIAEELQVTESGFPDQGRLNAFLSSIGLEYKHRNPFEDLTGIDSLIELITQIKTAPNQGHLLVAYDKLKLRGINQKTPFQTASFALFKDYFPSQDLIELHDPAEAEPVQITLGMQGSSSGLYDTMQAREDRRFGTYHLTERV